MSVILGFPLLGTTPEEHVSGAKSALASALILIECARIHLRNGAPDFHDECESLSLALDNFRQRVKAP